MTTPHSINGTPLDTYATVVSFGALFGPADFSGSDVLIPHRDGDTFGGWTRKGRDYPLTLRIRATGEGDYNAKASGLVALLTNVVDGRLQPYTLTRTLPIGAGLVTQSALARYDNGGQVIRRGNVGESWLGETLVVLRLLTDFEAAAA